MSTSIATPGSSLKKLGKKSTALDVVKTLNNASRLAPYVTKTYSNDKNDEQNIKNKPSGVAVVTGGSSGIGFTSVEALAATGMKIVLCARNVNAATEAISKLSPWSQSNVRIQKLDLADMKSIESAANEIRNIDGNIDVLLNNAGVMMPPQRLTTAQNLELQFGTNHVGHHMFTRYLLPSMNSGGRIVTVASAAHTSGMLDFTDLNFSTNKRPYNSWQAYGQSKLANVLFAKALNDKLEGGTLGRTDIVSLSLHPGVIMTNLFRYFPSFLQPLMRFGDRNVEQGAATSIFASLADDTSFSGGDYLQDCQISKPSILGQDTDGTLREQLWTATESIISDAGFVLPETLLSKSSSSSLSSSSSSSSSLSSTTT